LLASIGQPCATRSFEFLDQQRRDVIEVVPAKEILDDLRVQLVVFPRPLVFLRPRQINLINEFNETTLALAAVASLKNFCFQFGLGAFGDGDTGTALPPMARVITR
jgi:hypothetical protein